MLRPRYWILAIGVFAPAFGCGGAERPAQSAAESEADAPEKSSAEDSAPSSEESSGEAEESSAPPRATCDDGTCTPCGSALCPSGWYCDESAKGGPACGWLPECAKKPTCACVKRAFSGCGCEEQGGAAHVNCG